MLGHETDVFVIDTQAGRVYNFGEEIGIAEVHTKMQDICGPHDTKYFSERFIVIGGLEWGVESFNPKTRVSKSICNKKVVRSGRHFASQY